MVCDSITVDLGKDTHLCRDGHLVEQGTKREAEEGVGQNPPFQDAVL